MSAYVLRPAFREVEERDNFAYLVKPFLSAKLYVVGKQMPFDKFPQPFAQTSEVTGRLCLTASEDKALVEAIPGVIAIPTTGKGLLKEMESSHELIIAHSDSGDYLRLDQLDFIRKISREHPEL